MPRMSIPLIDNEAPRLFPIRIPPPKKKRPFYTYLYSADLPTMTAASKRQKREDYRKTHKQEGNAALPKKKFYRQRAHANPFSDHQLT